MKISVFSNDEKRSREVSKELINKIQQSGFEIDDETPEVVITVGGDGTLLSAFHSFQEQLDQIRFIGVHTGHLGFYTDWRDYELDDLVASLQGEMKTSVSYPLLDIFVSYRDGKEPDHFLALNEMSVKNTFHTMVSEVWIGDDFFESYRGDGLSVSTPTGSTAYSKSLGGSVVHPSVNAIQLNEIASLNNKVYRSLGSPLIVAPEEKIRIRLVRSDDTNLYIDNFGVKQPNIKEVVCSLSNQRIQFASCRHMVFWKRVRHAFIDNLEERGE